jgi:hypothetical protein
MPASDRGRDDCHCIWLFEKYYFAEDQVSRLARAGQSCPGTGSLARSPHPVLEMLHVEGFQSLTGIDDLLRGKKSRVKELTIERFIRSVGGQLVEF